MARTLGLEVCTMPILWASWSPRDRIGRPELHSTDAVGRGHGAVPCRVRSCWHWAASVLYSVGFGHHMLGLSDYHHHDEAIEAYDTSVRTMRPGYW